ncbi:MAG: metallophosphatase [Balneolaceae bacterium]
MRRENFLRLSIGLSTGFFLPGTLVRPENEEKSGLSILYTNDTHSRIDPFPEHAIRHAGKGGMARRAALIDQIRNSGREVLLLDAGDLFFGTSWYQVHGGRVEIELMNRMGYDAACLGEHDLTGGLDAFAEAASRANFPFLCANYRVKETPLDPWVRQFIIRERGGFRIGIFGLGINFYPFLKKEQYGALRYGNPYNWAERLVDHLRVAGRCDYLICLSHLGYRQSGREPDDCKLAEKVAGIDLIIGGHTHTFLDEPVSVKNAAGRTLVTQAGHSGLRLGRIDLVRNTEGVPVESTPQTLSVV